MTTIPTTPTPPPSVTPGRFAGKVALITGSSYKGIGGEIAMRIASEGGSVALLSRREPEKLLKRLQKMKAAVVHTAGDVTKGEDIERFIADALQAFGKIDVLVNNAGVELNKPLEKYPDEEWRQLLDVNLNGAIALSKAVLPRLTSGGVIVNIASALALGGCAGFAVYSASKAGMIGFTQSLAWEVAPRGIRVVAVAPGLVKTPMIVKHAAKLTEDDWKQIAASHPLGVGQPEDVASAVAFLASDDARWITGICLPLGWASHYPIPTQQFLE